VCDDIFEITENASELRARHASLQVYVGVTCSYRAREIA
jgi:hypothetical protein